jgi:hypothetical protein
MHRNTYADANSDCDCHCDRHANGHSYGHRNCHGNSYNDPAANAYGAPTAHSKATANCGAPAITLVCYFVTCWGLAS